MKGTTFISVSVALIIACFAVNSLAEDFYVIPSMRKNFAPVEKIGQTTCYWSDNSSSDPCTCGSNVYYPSEQDGGLQKGTE